MRWSEFILGTTLTYDNNACHVILSICWLNWSDIDVHVGSCSSDGCMQTQILGACPPMPSHIHTVCCVCFYGLQRGRACPRSHFAACYLRRCICCLQRRRYICTYIKVRTYIYVYTSTRVRNFFSTHAHMPSNGTASYLRSIITHKKESNQVVAACVGGMYTASYVRM